MSLKDLSKAIDRDNGKKLMPKLEQYLLSLNAEKEEGDGWIHPSGIGGCARAIALNVYKAPRVDTISPHLRRIFDNGTHVHRRFQTYLRRAGLTIDSDTAKYGEHSFHDDKLRIRGTCDGIMTGKETMLEIKSMNSHEFSRLGGPKTDHLWQAHIYMHFLKRVFPKLSGTIFLYENKDNQQVREFYVPFEEEIWKRILEKITFVNRHIDQKRLPSCGTEFVNCEHPGDDTKCPFAAVCAHGKKWVRKNIAGGQP